MLTEVYNKALTLFMYNPSPVLTDDEYTEQSLEARESREEVEEEPSHDGCGGKAKRNFSPTPG